MKAEPTPAAEPPATFDDTMNRLEACVERLETGQLSLEEALVVFEEGIAASRACARLLDQSRKRVQVLVENAGGDFQLAFLAADDDEAIDEEPEDDDL